MLRAKPIDELPLGLVCTTTYENRSYALGGFNVAASVPATLERKSVIHNFLNEPGRKIDRARYEEALKRRPPQCVMPEVLRTGAIESMRRHDVTVLMAPTGTGKTMSALEIGISSFNAEHAKGSPKITFTVPTIPQVVSVKAALHHIYNGQEEQPTIKIGSFHTATCEARATPTLQPDSNVAVLTHSMAAKVAEKFYLSDMVVVDEAHANLWLCADMVLTAWNAKKEAEANGVALRTGEEYDYEDQQAQGRPLRFLFLSATINEVLLERLKQFFEMHKLTYNVVQGEADAPPPFHMRMRNREDDPLYRASQAAALGEDRNHIYASERTSEYLPNPEVIRKRVVAALEVFIDAIIEKPDYKILVFLPGAEMISSVRREILQPKWKRKPAERAVNNDDPRWAMLRPTEDERRYLEMGGPPVNFTRYLPEYKITVSKMMSSDREDEELIFSERVGVQPQIILSTPILESGVTIPHLRVVIDSGLEKRVLNYCRSGIRYLEIIFCSFSSLLQRAGRIGRVCHGDYLCVLGSAHWKYTEGCKDVDEGIHDFTYDMRTFLTCKDYANKLFFPPPAERVLEFARELAVMGMVIDHAWFDDYLDVYPTPDNNRVRLFPFAHWVAQTLSSLDLRHGIFLLAAASANCALHGLCLVAYFTAGPAIFKTPSREIHRDHNDYAYTRIMRDVDADESEHFAIADTLVKLMYGERITGKKLNLNEASQLVYEDGLREARRLAENYDKMLVDALSKRIQTAAPQLKTFAQQCAFNDFSGPGETTLSKEARFRFRTAVLMAYGDRVMVGPLNVHEADLSGNRTLYRQPVHSSVDIQPKLISPESKLRSFRSLAVFHEATTMGNDVFNKTAISTFSVTHYIYAASVFQKGIPVVMSGQTEPTGLALWNNSMESNDVFNSAGCITFKMNSHTSMKKACELRAKLLNCLIAFVSNDPRIDYAEAFKAHFEIMGELNSIEGDECRDL